MVGSECSAGLRLLEQAVELLADQAPADLPGAQALAEAAALLVLQDRLAVVALRRIADVDTRALHDLDEHASTRTWVDAQATGTDRRAVALARKLTRLPQVTEEITAGRLSVEAAQRIGAALDAVRRHVDRPDGLLDGQPQDAVLEGVLVDGVLDLVATGRGGLADDDPGLLQLAEQLQEVALAPLSGLARLEAGFVLLAQHLERALLAPALTRLVDALLPLQLEERTRTGREQRSLRVRPSGDGTGMRLTAHLDVHTAELLATVLQAAHAIDPDNPLDTAAWRAERVGEVTDQPVRAPRSRAQQDHDALALALTRLLDGGLLGTRSKARPHLSVLVPLGALAGAPGALPAVGLTGLSVPASLVRDWAADCAVTRYVLGLGHRVLETSHTQRTLTASERRYVQVQWGNRCATSGCTPPPGSPLVYHHPDPWARCRRTSVFDSVPFCRRCHHDLHDGGHRIRLRDGRTLTPDGWA